MAILKCKMCGGDLEVKEGMVVFECEYCGTVQTISSNTDENIQRLFNRANTLRMKADFDKAEEIYEKILLDSVEEAEAYWGLILCKYGVEYVEEPKTHRRVPTCHRTSYESIVADENYKNAIKYAELSQRVMYETEAKLIDEIQKGILDISKNEEPYDVFICYKEADEYGKRTQDSVIANDIYYQLSQEGYKVFYAAITLEDKLGSEYEPYIFSALNSAKVMLALGTRPEYFNAVWVKNEWSRFLAIMKNDRTKLLIPCYRDMDAYELPEEFSHLQSQDMSKIGFINDVVRGIKKVIAPEVKESQENHARVNDGFASNVAPLLKRAEMFLEDREWSRADEFCEQVLNIEPENPLAYLYKLMGDMKVSKVEHLKNCAKPFEVNNNYRKCIRFADAGLVQQLESYIVWIKERNEKDHKNQKYDYAVNKMNLATTEIEFQEVARLFGKIPGWKDSDIKLRQAKEKAEITRKDAVYNRALKKAEATQSSSIYEAFKDMGSISGWKDADEKAQEFLERFKSMEAKEQERKYIDSLRARYDKIYRPVIEKKKELELNLKNAQEALLKEKCKSMGNAMGSIISGVCAVAAGILCIAVELGCLGVSVLLIGIFSLLAGITMRVEHVKSIERLEEEQISLSNQLKEIGEIPSASDFIKKECEKVSDKL